MKLKLPVHGGVKVTWGEDEADAGLYPYYNIPNGLEGGIYPASNMYIELPTGGSASGTVRLYEGMSMTVVVEP